MHYDRMDISLRCQSGRLFRLAVKLGFIIDRPEQTYSEDEKTYLVKLFRDFVFHSVDDHDKPIVDFAHVIQALNRVCHACSC